MDIDDVELDCSNVRKKQKIIEQEEELVIDLLYVALLDNNIKDE